MNRDAMLTCSSSDLSFLVDAYPDTWWANGASDTGVSYLHPMVYVRTYMPCCLYCVWSLEYPATVAIVTLYGPILNCASFVEDFIKFDRNSDERLSRAEFQLYLDKPLNSVLTKRRFLDPEYVFTAADLDRNKFISSGEFMVLRHFWAVAELTRTGPTMLSSGKTLRDLADGPLGGLFLDRGQLELWFTGASSLTSEHYSNRQLEGWDSQLIRDATDSEKAAVFSRLDLDGSGMISLEEHYYRYFADLNGDGWLSKSEYYLSLYRNVNEAGEQDNPYLYPINFNLHDWNRDGRVSFQERKYVAADLDANGRLTAAEWMRADFPESALADGQDMTWLKYFYYSMLLACTRSGGWSPDCLLEVRFQHLPPFTSGELLPAAQPPPANRTEPAGSACEFDANCTAGRACSYFGYCHDVALLRPQGGVARRPQWKAEPGGMAVEVWKEVARRLGYNYTLVLSDLVTLEDAEVGPWPHCEKSSSGEQ
jgi:Ca2+-binding EF-hand superfamily protein